MTSAGDRVTWRRLVVEATVVATGTVLALAIHLRLWRAAWREPWVRGGDADFYLMLARTLDQHGSYLHNPNLGWPFGQNLADLPHGADNLHLFALRLVAAVTGGPGAAVNVFFVGTFAVVAFTSHLVLRRLGLSRVASGVGAFVYAFAPYHFLRSEGHLLLSGYEMVPIGVLLALALFDEPLPLLRTDRRRGVDLRSRRTWLVVVAAIALASTGPYYFVFSMMLVATAGALHALISRTWRPIASAGLVVGVGVVTFAVNVSPSLLNTLRHGTNSAVAHRSPFETQLYGLKIFQLFVPREGHRIGVLDRAGTRSLGHEVFYRSESGQQLGVLCAVSLAVILVIGARRLVGRGAPASMDVGDDLLVGRLSMLALVCMLVGASGGISFLVSAIGLREIRAWSRISIVIAFLAVVGLALAIDRVGEWLRIRMAARPQRSRWAPAAPAALAVLVAIVAYLDQGGKDTPAYATIHARYTSDSAFFATVRDRLGSGAAVYNLPYQPFPEAPPRGGVGEFEETVGYIFEPTLNWSFGAMRGRVPDYQKVLETQPAEEWMTSIAAVGFTGIVIDRSGYSPDDLAAQEAAITALAGPAVLSSDSHYSFFDLRTFAAEVHTQLGEAGVKTRAEQTLTLRSTPTLP